MLCYTGGRVGYTTAMYSFLADISSPSMLAFRMAMVHISEMTGKPIGTQIGALLITYSTVVVNTSVSLGLLICGSVFLYFRIHKAKWHTDRKVQTSISIH
jgi:hypothetical protein